MDRTELTVLEGGKMDKKQALEHALATALRHCWDRAAIARWGKKS